MSNPQEDFNMFEFTKSLLNELSQKAIQRIEERNELFASLD